MRWELGFLPAITQGLSSSRQEASQKRPAEGASGTPRPLHHHPLPVRNTKIWPSSRRVRLRSTGIEHPAGIIGAMASPCTLSVAHAAGSRPRRCSQSRRNHTTLARGAQSEAEPIRRARATAMCRPGATL